MSRLPRTLLLAIRALALVQLLLGAVLWSGRPPVPWRGLHIAGGLLLALLVLALGAAVSRAAGRAGAVLAALGWVILLVGYGMAHPRVLPGGAHGVAQLAHVLLGLATVGVAERLTRTAPSRAAEPAMA